MNIKNNFSINSIIGDVSFFCGEYSSNEPFRIDGKYKGKINSGSKVYIGKTGSFEGILVANNVDIGGQIKGDIYALEKVMILKTAKINGAIYSCSINMEDDVVIDGEFRTLTKEDMKELYDMKLKEKLDYSK